MNTKSVYVFLTPSRVSHEFESNISKSIDGKPDVFRKSIYSKEFSVPGKLSFGEFEYCNNRI